MLAVEFQVVLYMAINLLSLYTLNNAISLFLKRKAVNSKSGIKVVVYILYFVIGTITYFWQVSPITNILTQVLLTFVIMIPYSGSFGNKLVIVCSYTTGVVLLELIVGITYSIHLKTPLSQIVNDDISKIIGSLMAGLALLLVVKTLQLYQRKKEASERFCFFDSLQVAIIPVCSIFIMHTLKELSKYVVSNVQWLVVAALLCVVFINLLFYFLFDRLRKIEKLKYENELLKNQSEYYIELEKQINLTFEKIRTIKHDLKHNLVYLKAKLQEQTEDSLSEVENKIDLLIGEVLSDNIKLYTKNQKLNRILNYKLFSADKENINTEVKVSIRENASIDESSLYIILGNAIDNAIEYLNNSASLEKKIAIRILEDNNNLILKIQNPFIGYLDFKNGLPLTTKQNRTMHGIGLQSIKKFVQDKNGYLKISILNNIFSLEILLYDEIKNK
ncbi:MAG: GHKL domain-containing protein [Clostridia bacterium]|nr:GHKL domain-containing protein [Clostridia bacterium]